VKKIWKLFDYIFSRLNELNWASLALFCTLLTILYAHQASEWSVIQSEYKAKRTLLRSLETELVRMRPWAEPAYSDDPLAVYQKEKRHWEWYSPALHLFSFNISAVKNFTTNPAFFDFDTSLVDSISLLDQKVNTVYERQNELSKFVFASPELYRKAKQWIKDGQNFAQPIDQNLEDYLSEIYSRNYEIYVCGIGGEPRVKSDCGNEKIGLHDVWVSSLKKIDDSIKALKPPFWLHYFWPPIGLLLFFGIPSTWSFLKRTCNPSIGEILKTILYTLLVIAAVCGGVIFCWNFISPSSSSDKIQTGLGVIQLFSIFILGGIALFQENIKRRWFYPELKLGFSFGPPDCHKTELHDASFKKIADAYYFRFSVTNIGRTHAQLCEAVLEKLWTWNSQTNAFEQVPRWNPINLNWAGRTSSDEFRTINPGRKVYCDIGHIDSRQSSIFFLEAFLAPFNQENFFRKGKYKFEISVYSENSRKGSTPKFEIVLDWSGEWHDQETVMFAEKIRLDVQSIYAGLPPSDSPLISGVLARLKKIFSRDCFSIPATNGQCEYCAWLGKFKNQ